VHKHVLTANQLNAVAWLSLCTHGLAGMKFTPGTVLELLQVTLHANELNRKLMDRAEEIRRTCSPAFRGPR
jgi:hypothetical protein